MYYASHSVTGDQIQESTFFPMEGNLRVAITPMDHLAILGTQGIVIQSPGFPNPYTARELYALFRGLAHGAYVRAGRFRLPFGLRQEDHTSFTREALPYDAQKEDAGIEVGAVGKNWFGQASFTNGAAPFAGTANTSTAKVGWAGRAFQVGLSGYVEAYGSQSDIYRGSLYASATLGRTTFLGEYVNSFVDPESDKEAAFAELVCRVSRGVNLRGKIDYRGLYFVAGPSRRYTVEADLNPMPFTNVKLSYRRYNHSGGQDLDEVFAMLFVPF
jgi:hypothetical protein